MIGKAVTIAQKNIVMTCLVIVAVILVVTVYMFYTAGQSAAQDLKDIQRDLTMAQVELNSAIRDYDVDKLRDQLDALNSAVSAAEALNRFPAIIDRDQLELKLANEASRRGVTLLSLSSVTKSGTETIGQNTYIKSEIGITVEAYLNNTSQFLTSMEQGDFPTLRFKNVSLAKGTTGDKWTTTITLVVLSQA